MADQVAGVRAYILAALESGSGPADVARQIVGKLNRATGLREGGIVGLHSQMQQWVINARAELSDPATAERFLQRVARNRNFDRLIAKAARDGRKLTQSEIDRIATDYAQRLLKLRGQTIARTEGITALRAGQHEAWLQTAEKTGVTVDVRWQATPDPFTRHSHMALNGQKVVLGQTFQTETGARLAYPGDTSHGAPAGETINCRCVAIYRARPKV